MATDLEPVIVSNDAEKGFLYLIDGSNRSSAEFLTGSGFQDVPAYVCVHPRMREWVYVEAVCDRARNKSQGEHYLDFYAK
jgi:hypothetical protein